MNFLTPLYALAGLAILAPLIFHLIRRRPKSQIEFSTHLFLERNHPQLSRSPRIENWFLLLLRVSAILLLATAFTRPYWGTPAIEQIAPERLERVLLIDSSASMRRDGLAEIAREKAFAWSESLNANDRLAIYSCNEVLSPLLSLDESTRYGSSQQAVKETLKQYEPTWLGNNWRRIFDLLNEQVQSLKDSAPVEIVIITDLQGTTNWQDLAAIRWPPNVRILIDSINSDSPSASNASIRLLQSDSSAAIPEKLSITPSKQNPIGKAIQVINSSASQSTTVATKNETFEIQWVDRQGAPIPGVQNLRATVLEGRRKNIPIGEIPTNASALELTGDDVVFDNLFYIQQSERVNRTILVLGDSNQSPPKSPAYFLKQIPFNTEQYQLNVLPIDVTPGQPEEALISEIQWNKVQYVVLTSGASELLANEVLAKELKSYLAEGGHLLWVWDEYHDTLNEKANAISQFLFEGKERLGSITEAPIDDYSLLEDLKLHDAIFNGLSDSRFNDFTKVHIWSHRQFSPQNNSDWTALAKFDDGAPAILRRNRLVTSEAGTTKRTGEVVLFTFGWQPEQSQLALSSKFVPLLSNLIEDSFENLDEINFKTVGDSLRIPAQSSVQWLTTNPITSIAFENEADYLLDRPGVLEVKTRESSTQHFAINVSEKESSLAPIELVKLAQQGVPLADFESREALSPEQKDALIANDLSRKKTIGAAQIEESQHFWRWILYGVTCLVFIESICLLRSQTKRLSTDKSIT